MKLRTYKNDIQKPAETHYNPRKHSQQTGFSNPNNGQQIQQLQQTLEETTLVQPKPKTILVKDNRNKSSNHWTAGTLAKNQPSTRESKRWSVQHNNIGPKIPEPSVHGTKPEPIRLTRNSKSRRDKTPETKASSSSEPSSESLKSQLHYTASSKPPKTERIRSKSGNHTY